MCWILGCGKIILKSYTRKTLASKKPNNFLDFVEYRNFFWQITKLHLYISLSSLCYAPFKIFHFSHYFFSFIPSYYHFSSSSLISTLFHLYFSLFTFSLASSYYYLLPLVTIIFLSLLAMSFIYLTISFLFLLLLFLSHHLSLLLSHLFHYFFFISFSLIYVSFSFLTTFSLIYHYFSLSSILIVISLSLLFLFLLHFLSHICHCPFSLISSYSHLYFFFN